jgi:LAGLIDADG endonuclease
MICPNNLIIIKSINERTSETLRCNFTLSDTENIKKISIHVPTYYKPESEFDLGHYLAGLIDGDGHFSKALQLVIVFNELDASLAYFIKKTIGFGNIYKVKNKKAILFVISNKIGLLKVLNLINGKIRSENKLNQIYNNILSNPYFNSITDFSLNSDTDLKNYWLSGFSDADASFQIKLINRINRKRNEVRLSFQIDQKKDDLLILIKNFIGGNIGYRKSQDTYYYSSTSFGSAKKVISYFDHYHLLSSKYINYLKWRKAYIIIQDKNHLTDSGLDKIIKLKFSMNRNNLENVE